MSENQPTAYLVKRYDLEGVLLDTELSFTKPVISSRWKTEFFPLFSNVKPDDSIEAVGDAYAWLFHEPPPASSFSDGMVDSVAYARVRVDTEPGKDGWCFCTPYNHPEDVARGLADGEANDRAQFFGQIYSASKYTEVGND